MSLVHTVSSPVFSGVLLADIGGTYSRFAVGGPAGQPERIVTFANDEFASFDEVVASYLGELEVQPDTAVLAVAGPVNGREIALTNRKWLLHLDDLTRRFGFSRIVALNDFEAVAWALSRFETKDIRYLGAPVHQACSGAKVVLGPGTGLGVAALVPAGKGWQAVASEGGHTSFGPDSEEQEPIFARLREHGRVSAETVLSGPGLARLHAAMHPATVPLAPETIVAHALAGDRVTHATIRMFVQLLGRFAGDIALVFKATGGVYITGGVALGLDALLDEKLFRDSFEAHPPYRDMLAAVPTYLVTCVQPGLIGCAARADVSASSS
jgi:glucokinase